MTCKYCRERIEDDAPVIETADGANVCEACASERLERLEPETAQVCE